jgi:hypothetical protein
MSEIKPLSAFPTSAAVSTSLKKQIYLLSVLLHSCHHYPNLLHKPTSLKLSITSILSSALPEYSLRRAISPPKNDSSSTQHFSHFYLHVMLPFYHSTTGKFFEISFIFCLFPLESFFTSKKLEVSFYNRLKLVFNHNFFDASRF